MGRPCSPKLAWGVFLNYLENPEAGRTSPFLKNNIKNIIVEAEFEPAVRTNCLQFSIVYS
jgi:hypothetical protein